ncbi:uncharacterized protein [Hetaerina americana]
MNEYFMHQLKYIFQYPQKVLDLPNVYSNILFLTVSLSLLYVFYFKIGQAFKEGVTTRIHQWNSILYSLWQIVCHMLMIAMGTSGITAVFPTTVGDISIRETSQIPEMAISFTSAILLHSVCLSWKYNGFNRISFHGLLTAIALYLSYGAKCLKIGVTFVLIWSAISLVVEVICLTINVTEMIYKKPMGAKPSLLIAVFFSGAWVFFYLYLYPLFVLLPVSALNSKNSSVSFVSLLLLTLWGKYLLDWYSSPFLKFLWMSTIKSFPENWLRSLLFIQKNDVTEKLMLIRKGEREKEKNMVKQRAQVEDVKTRQNSQTVMQTIR